MIKIEIKKDHFQDIYKELKDVLNSDKYKVDQEASIIYVKDEDAKEDLADELTGIAASHTIDGVEMDEYGIYLEGLSDGYFED